MSLTRAFTMRNKRSEIPDVGAGPARFASVRKRGGDSFDRNMISSPVALLSTTNMLSYNAPDIASIRSPSSSSSSTHSSDDSDIPGSSRSHMGESFFFTDPSSAESSPTAVEAEPNHLTSYFKSRTPRRSASSGSLGGAYQSSYNAPAVPLRAPSHSKRAHERIARQRSLNNIAPPTTIPEHRTSMELLGSPPPNGENPFSKELEQLDEVAEEFGGVVRDAAWEEDMVHMKRKHLARFCANDYMTEIQPLFSGVFEDPYAWI